MRYPIAIEAGDQNHAWGVTVPDLPGCFSAGDTMEEALGRAREAIELHIEGMRADGVSIPAASDIESLCGQSEFANCVWACVSVG